jgi:alcohol dehydrogenase (cytochrome c)
VKPALLLTAALLRAQGLDPAELLKAPTTNWPTFNGDYSGRRYSSLSQIDRTNAGTLT